MRIHHIGYAVSSLPDSIESFTQIGYILENKTTDTARHVEIALMRNGHLLVELVCPASGEGNRSPADTVNRSPVDAILEKNGPMPYHICYAVGNLAQMIQTLKESGWTLIIKPAPAPALQDALVAFLYHKTQGVIELVETGGPAEKM